MQPCGASVQFAPWCPSSTVFPIFPGEQNNLFSTGSLSHDGHTVLGENIYQKDHNVQKTGGNKLWGMSRDFKGFCDLVEKKSVE